MDKYESRPIIYGTRDYPLMRFRHGNLDEEQCQDGKNKCLNKSNKEFKGIQRHRDDVWDKEHNHHQERLPCKDISEKSE